MSAITFYTGLAAFYVGMAVICLGHMLVGVVCAILIHRDFNRNRRGCGAWTQESHVSANATTFSDDMNEEQGRVTA